MSENRKKAIVTGASSGIGKAISRVLCKAGIEVYGIGREFHEQDIRTTISTESDCLENNFHPVVCDLLDTDKLKETVTQISKDRNISILVNNAGVAYYGLHEELNTDKIQRMVRTNLEVPMVLTQLLLRQLKENHGMIINISSISAKHSSPHGCAYAATKAGLSSFSQSLYDEARKYGVRVVTIHPDMTATQLYRNADFREAEEEDARLLPEDVADAVSQLLLLREGLTVTDLTIQPQKHRIRKK